MKNKLSGILVISVSAFTLLGCGAKETLIRPIVQKSVGETRPDKPRKIRSSIQHSPTDKGSHYPHRIANALNKIKTIPHGMKEGEVFAFLGLPKPDSEFTSQIVGRTNQTRTRYQIGFQKEFLLECEAVMDSNAEYFSFDASTLTQVFILRRKKEGSRPPYETLTPHWSALE